MHKVDMYTALLVKQPKWMGYGMESDMDSVNLLIKTLKSVLVKDYESAFKAKGYLTNHEKAKLNTLLQKGLGLELSRKGKDLAVKVLTIK
jgi:hypothetical protein